MTDFIPISALSEYDYCPRNCYLFFVLGERGENPYTVEGKLLHERVNEPTRTKRGVTVQSRRAYVFSARYGISGFADVIEEKEGDIYPIEYKRGKRGIWRNDRIQLCAQAICLEDMLGIEIAEAYIFYVSSGRRMKVELDSQLRQDTIETMQKIRKLFTSEVIPKPVFSNRCNGCSLKPLCLPKETAQLKKTKLAWK
jgi:CRISPR-associated exonuclease Cas4